MTFMNAPPKDVAHSKLVWSASLFSMDLWSHLIEVIYFLFLTAEGNSQEDHKLNSLNFSARNQYSVKRWDVTLIRFILNPTFVNIFLNIVQKRISTEINSNFLWFGISANSPLHDLCLGLALMCVTVKKSNGYTQLQ